MLLDKLVVGLTGLVSAAVLQATGSFRWLVTHACWLVYILLTILL